MPFWGSPYALAYRIGTRAAIDRILLSDWEPFDRDLAVRHLGHWEVPVLPLSGGALVERGLSKGPEVARTLRLVEEQWIAERFPDAARVAELADAAVAQALRSASSA
ncbi:MAG: hypothetical protein IH998_07855 [Proteobacteria bacterium]|nr:hypothetical protein [Pseudomonadota bacterium]